MHLGGNWIPDTQKSIERREFIKNKYLNGPMLKSKEPVEKKQFYFTMENENTDPPIFIIGCGHSGTTILRKMIGSHSKVYDIGYETDMFLKPIDTIEKLHTVARRVEELNKNTLMYKKRRWIEKTPRHVHHIDTIKKFFPESKIIVLTRHPISGIKSLHHRYKNLKKSVVRYIEDNMTWQTSKYRNTFHVIKYEDLIQNTQEVIKTLQNFLGLEYEDLTKYEKTNRVVEYDDRICAKCGSKNIRKTTCFGTLYHCTVCKFHGAYNDIENIRHRQLRDSQVNRGLFNKLHEDEDPSEFTEKQIENMINFELRGVNLQHLSCLLDYSII